LFSDAQVLILDEPTQGIDIGAKVAVYKLINTLTRAGKSIILISSDHDELLAMSDRIAIVQQGTIKKTVEAVELAMTTCACVGTATFQPCRGGLRMRRIFDTQLIGPFAAMMIVRSSWL
jgi:ABC-type sugar transport system ATPase subunit